MAKRIGPEAKIIALFSALSDDSKRIVADVIKSQTATPRKAASPKSHASSAEKKSSRKPARTGSEVSTGTHLGIASSAGVALPDNPEDYQHGATA